MADISPALTIVLGAPGSGKSTVVGPLREVCSGWVVIDWDELMPVADALSGRDVRTSPDLWGRYRDLMRSVVDAVSTVPTILLTVCTPDELRDWPETRWILLDCSDEERRCRLADRPSDIASALLDAAHYRTLALPRIDSTGRVPSEVARSIAAMIADD